MVEVQALVDHSPLSNPRRVAVGMEGNRLAIGCSRSSIATAASRWATRTSSSNVVGGIRLQETAVELPCCWPCCPRLRDRPLGDLTVAFGEVGLSGEIRPVPNGEGAHEGGGDAGFKRAIVRRRTPRNRGKVAGMEVIAVERLADALEHA